MGDSVKIIDGPLEGFVGVVDEIDKTAQSVKVTVSMFGRETPVELKFGQVAALEKYWVVLMFYLICLLLWFLLQ